MRILLVSKEKESLLKLKELTERLVHAECGIALGSSEARRMLLDEYWDLAIVNFPLSDESGENLINMILTSTESSAIALIKSDLVHYFDSLIAEGALIVEKPLNTEILRQTIEISESVKRMREDFNKQIRKLEMKIEELKIFSRAKCLLIEKKHISEEEAHKMIEKLAMDRRASLREASLVIINGFGEK